ncbi:hypothetical protein SDC9_50600 [bioreactor metagenome]|uniref:Uncharacterized protein n=1 Tax=bioreactor metagenome TaxID=1076179 RepID=A0A644WPU1_9ZZZZ
MHLPKIGAVACGNHGNIRNGAAGERGKQPEMVRVDNVRPEPGRRLQDRRFEDISVGRELPVRQVGKPHGRIGHNVAHARYREWEVSSPEGDETGPEM